MEVNQIIELMKAVSETGLTDFCYEENGVVLKLKKHPEKKIVAPVAAAAPAASAVEYAPQTASAGEPDTEGDETPQISGNVIKSPLVGTFYSASAPDEAPYVQVGDTVHKGQVLGIVEAMKLMNEIESEYDGVVKAILVNNGDLIEYDEPMFIIE